MYSVKGYQGITGALPILGMLGLFAGTAACAQAPVDEAGNPITSIEYSTVPGGNTPVLTAVELEALVGPVALYPDDLLAIVLPASTYPIEIVQAARFRERFEADSSLTPAENWDDSIVALLNYPEVLKMMNDDLDWTWKLGEAVVAQQSAVVAALESFRDKAYRTGNLKSDEYQRVTNSEGVIEIEPVSEKEIYVPYYEPERVIVYSSAPVYRYYPRPYPLYYYPYASDFNFGFFWGVTTAFSIGWASDYLHVYHHSYRGHPYYRRSYNGHHYRHRSINAYNNYYVNNHKRRAHDQHRNGDYWRPRHTGGARPGHHIARNKYYRRGSREGVSAINKEQQSRPVVNTRRPRRETITSMQPRKIDSRRPDRHRAVTPGTSARGTGDTRHRSVSRLDSPATKSSPMPSKPPRVKQGARRSAIQPASRQAQARVSKPERQLAARTQALALALALAQASKPQQQQVARSQPRTSSSARPAKGHSRALAGRHAGAGSGNRSHRGK